MDNKLILKDFSNICDILSKYSGDSDVIMSNGVFIWKNDGLFTLCTFTEKIEKNIVPLLHGVYKFNPSFISQVNKYSPVEDMSHDENQIELVFKDLFKNAVANFSDVNFIIENLHRFKKINDELCTFTISRNYEISENILHIFNKLENLDLDNIEEVEISTEEITKSESAITIDTNGYKVRIAKSLFLNVTKSDRLTLRFIPYVGNTSIFLVMATNNKEKCKLINLVDAVRL